MLRSARVFLAIPPVAFAATTPPGPPAGLTWSDVPNDAGRAIELDWKASPDDTLGTSTVIGYYVERSESPAGPWTVVDSTAAHVTVREDQSVQRNVDYFYRVTAYGPGGNTSALSVTGPVRATSQWINQTRWSVLVFVVGFFAAVLFFMASAQAGRKPFVRRIPGIDAIEEAIGRATEMGRPVLYVPGITDIDDIQTVAGLVILESVAKITARYETPITVPVTYPIPVHDRPGDGEERLPERRQARVVRSAQRQLRLARAVRLRGGGQRHHAARPAGGAHLHGLVLRRVAAAGRDRILDRRDPGGRHRQRAQLPFFVVACDYTLIGEELFAASAYLSGEPKLVGSLKGADLLKLAIVAAIVVGCALETFGIHGFTVWMITQ